MKMSARVDSFLLEESLMLWLSVTWNFRFSKELLRVLTGELGTGFVGFEQGGIRH